VPNPAKKQRLRKKNKTLHHDLEAPRQKPEIVGTIPMALRRRFVIASPVTSTYLNDQQHFLGSTKGYE
jgi:hypothetical protein